MQVEAPTDTRDVVGPYRITAVVRGAVSQVEARYILLQEGGTSDPLTVTLERRGDARFEADLPGQRAGSVIQVVLVADGPGGGRDWPGENPHEFRIFDADGRCLVDGDCLDGEICDRVSLTCKAPPAVCGSDADCPQDRVCQDGICRFRPSVCEVDADCGDARVCENGLCVSRPECVVDGDCPGGRCVPPGRCVIDEPCPGGCPDGFECIDNSCVDPGACGGCPAGTRCHVALDRCVECTADGHCESDGHCTLAPDFTCAEGPRLAACTPCGPGGSCGFDQICMADTGFLCMTLCNDEGDCPSGSFCDGQVCRSDFICGGIDCRRDEECEGACLAGTCTPRQDCNADSDCADGWSCAGGRCLPRGATCFGPGDCERGQICVGGRCQRGEPEGACAPCNGPASCPSPALCVDLDGTGPRCVAICGRSGCPDGLQCFEALPFGVCLTADATCATPLCGRDVMEPNDTIETARDVVPGGTEAAVCQGDQDHLILPALGAAGRVSFTALTGRVDVLRVLADGTVLDDRTYPPGAGFETELFNQPQLLRLTTQEPFDVRYSIAFFVDPGDCDDDFLEDNDTQEEATILGDGADVNPVACAGDEDWFRLRMREGEVGHVRIDLRSEGRIEWAHIDGSGMILSEDNFAEGVETVIPVAFREAQYLRIRCVECGELRYNITTAFSAGAVCEEDRLEPNDSVNEIRDLGVPVDLDGLTVCAADEDWYLFQVQGGLEASFNLDFRHADGDIELEVFDENLVAVDASTTATDHEQVDLPVRRRDRVYIARVYLFPGRGEQNTYRLRVNLR